MVLNLESIEKELIFQNYFRLVEMKLKSEKEESIYLEGRSRSLINIFTFS